MAGSHDADACDQLLALRAQPPVVDVPTAEAVAKDLYAITARATPLDGERDRNFRLDTADGRQLVLKFIDHEADDVVVDGQSAVLVHLAEQDLQMPVPRVIRPLTTPPAGCRVRLVTYLAGRPVQDFRADGARADMRGAGESANCVGTPAGGAGVRAGGASESLLRSVGTQVGRLDLALRGFFHPALGQPIVWDVRRAPALLSELPGVESAQARRLVADAVEPIQSLLPRLRGLRSQAIHGDCHGRNLLSNEQGTECVGIIDLGDMIHAPLALEIAVTMAELLVDNVTSLDGMSHLLAGYTAVQPLVRGDFDVLYELIAARIGIAVLIQTWRVRNGAGAVVHGLEESSLAALESLATRGKAHLTDAWLDAAGAATGTRASAGTGAAREREAAGLLRRRHAALGANAELSYERPLHLVRGEGVWVYTADGERLLDVYNNVPHVGHAHPAVVEAIAQQARLIASNTRYLDERIIEYVERLTATLPRDLDACLFVNSGSEANDIAWRIAKSHTGHGGALVMKFAYHGITDAVTALSPAISTVAAPHVEQIAAPAQREVDAASAIDRLKARGFGLAALMIDSALTSTGIYDPPPSWVAPIASAVRSLGALIIADEVQFGLGRSGTDFWGFKRRGYHPDIVTLGKPVGNGYPMGVVVTRRAILEKFQRDTGFFSTFGGNPVAGAAGLAVLDVLERERLMENARTTGDYFIAKLRELAPKHGAIKDVRGRGLMIGVEVADRVLTRQLVNALRDRGVLIGSEGPMGNVLKLRPPMPFRPEHADVVIDALTRALSAFGS